MGDKCDPPGRLGSVNANSGRKRFEAAVKGTESAPATPIKAAKPTLGEFGAPLRAMSFSAEALSPRSEKGTDQSVLSVVLEAKGRADSQLKGFLCDDGLGEMIKENVAGLIGCGGREFADGTYRDIVKKLRALAMDETALGIRQKRALTKILLAVSRVMRLLEFYGIDEADEPFKRLSGKVPDGTELAEEAAKSRSSSVVSRKSSASLESFLADESLDAVSPAASPCAELDHRESMRCFINPDVPIVFEESPDDEFDKSPTLPSSQSAQSMGDDFALPAPATPRTLQKWTLPPRPNVPPPLPPKIPAAPAKTAWSTARVSTDIDRTNTTYSPSVASSHRKDGFIKLSTVAKTESPAASQPKNTGMVSYFVQKMKMFVQGVGKDQPKEQPPIQTQRKESIVATPILKPPPAPPIPPPRQTPKFVRSNTVVCRICERMVPADSLDEHMRLCSIVNNAHYRIESTTSSLILLAKTVHSRISDPTNSGKPVVPFLSSMVRIIDRICKSELRNPDQTVVVNIETYCMDIKALKSAAERIPASSADDLQVFFRNAVALCDKLVPQVEQLRQLLSKDPSLAKCYNPHRNVTIKDFHFVRPISKGAFGNVYLAKKKRTGDYYAIKRLNKKQALLKNQIPHITAERNILALTNNPFLIRSYYSFQTRTNLYLVMEYAAGGDLYTLLKNFGCMPEAMAKVYLAQVVLALEYLHSLGIVHRDLKPDNILVCNDGHIKLTDFGLSRYGLLDDQQNNDNFNTEFVETSELDIEYSPALPPTPIAEKRDNRQKHRKRFSVVGTPDYLAPEVILGTGHDKSVDWWSLGVIAYEFVTGIPPFNDDSPQKIFENIINRAIVWPAVPEEISPSLFDLINRLLCTDPAKRLGSKAGAADIKTHAFFTDTDWDSLLDEENAVFIPQLESAEDTSYFDQDRRGSFSGLLKDLRENGEDSIYSTTTSGSGNEVTASDSECGSFSDVHDSNSFSNTPGPILGNARRKPERRQQHASAIPEISRHEDEVFSNFSYTNIGNLRSLTLETRRVSKRKEQNARLLDKSDDDDD